MARRSCNMGMVSNETLPKFAAPLAANAGSSSMRIWNGQAYLIQVPAGAAAQRGTLWRSPEAGGFSGGLR